MDMVTPEPGCNSPAHWTRRTWLKAAASLGGASWLTTLAERLALADPEPDPARAHAVIVLWLAGGPSQLESFDPHPGTRYSGDTRAISTAARGVRLGSGLPQLAEEMQSVSLIRSLVSKEGDHERATYNMKTGFRPDPTLVHPSIGAVLCHQKRDDVEIPRHVSILPSQWPARGGYLGAKYDAFKMGDPQAPVPDITRQVPQPRFRRRVKDLLDVLEPEFRRGRMSQLDQRKTLHVHSVHSALKMMSSEQLAAFDVSQESKTLRRQFGETPFGRGCLAALRLIGVGVRCVEVTLNGWDSHANNHAIQNERLSVLDPAFSTLIRELRKRELLERTIVLCGGEFGRTPRINPAGGRDHWPHGFSVALAGGGIRGGLVVGETAAEPKLDEKNELADVSQPHNVADIHATVYRSLGIDFEKEMLTPVGRPMALSKGAVIRELLAGG